MKQWILAALALTGVVGVAQSFELDLRTEVDRLRQAVYRRGHLLPAHKQQEVTMKMIEIRNYILDGGHRPPPERGYFCTAACGLSDRTSPDLRYSAGAEGRFELEAKNAAREAVRGKWSCPYGIVDVECSPVDGFERFCVASCAYADRQTADLRYSYSGTGRSESEAKVRAREQVSSRVSCSYGIVDYDCTRGYERPAYCVAACAKSDRASADLNYSKGASANSRLEATYAAIDAVRSSWRCPYGVVVSECSE